MKSIFAKIVLLAVSSTALLSATTEVAASGTQCPPAACPSTPAQQQMPMTMTADQQLFCNTLNAKNQQMFKAMDNDSRSMVMDMAKTKDPNQAMDDMCTKMAPK